MNLSENSIWIPNHPVHHWVPGRIKSTTEDSVIAEGPGGTSHTIPKSEVLYIKQPLKAPEDLLQLDDFNEPLVLHTLKTRYLNSQIYSAVGPPVVLAVNPYTSLDLYTEAHKHLYRGSDDLSFTAAPPHLFKIAEQALRGLRRSGQSQSIIITGDSGAGKTESTKILLNYLGGSDGSSGVSTGVEARVLLTNPVLEAFGNAKTLRNDNSSRFGKFVELEVDDCVRSAVIETYLLEKSRVVFQAPNERNYHIFYQLLWAEDPSTPNNPISHPLSSHRSNRIDTPSNLRLAALRRRLGLNPDVRYPWLNVDFDDAAGRRKSEAGELNETVRRMLSLGFEEAELVSLFSALAAILHLSRMTPKATEVNGGEGSTLEGDGSAKIASELLGLSQESLNRLICWRTLREPGTGKSLARPLTVSQANGAREAVAKNIYSVLFDWLVSRVNSSVRAERLQPGRARARFGLLDIFGFEAFERNSLEQLCINFANERLQAHFNAHMCRIEQTIYEEEGIKWTPLPVPDNSHTIALIAGRPLSVFALLEEEGSAPGGNDSRLLEKIRQKLTPPALIPRGNSAPRDSFGVRHFAGEVFYIVDGLVEKNRGGGSAAVAESLVESSDPLLRSLFAPDGRIQTRRVDAVSSQFCAQLDGLVARLEASPAFYVRCIKPNSLKEKQNFNAGEVLTQVQAGGVLEAARVRRAGFACRIDRLTFVREFRPLILDIKDPFSWLSEVLPTGSWQIGKTKVFLKENAKTILDYLLAQTRKVAATNIQRVWRGRKVRMRIHILRQLIQLIRPHLRFAAEARRAERARSSLDALIQLFRGFKQKSRVNAAVTGLARLLDAQKISRRTTMNPRLTLAMPRIDQVLTSPSLIPVTEEKVGETNVKVGVEVEDLPSLLAAAVADNIRLKQRNEELELELERAAVRERQATALLNAKLELQAAHIRTLELNQIKQTRAAPTNESTSSSARYAQLKLALANIAASCRELPLRTHQRELKTTELAQTLEESLSEELTLLSRLAKFASALNAQTDASKLVVRDLLLLLRWKTVEARVLRGLPSETDPQKLASAEQGLKQLASDETALRSRLSQKLEYLRTLEALDIFDIDLEKEQPS